MNTKLSKNDFLIYALMLLAMLPWLLLQLETRVPADAAFLYTGAKHFLSGLAMKDYYYDNNPPLCFLIYIPAALLNFIGISAPYAITSTALAYIIIGLFFTDYFLRANDKFSRLEKLIILASYLCAITIACFIEFAQKDHLISISLMPFLLAQTSNPPTVSEKHKTYRIICLIFFTPFLLIKPHYLFLPLSIIIYRVNKNLPLTKSLIKIDSLILAAGVFIYALIILCFFTDYLLEILPFASVAYAVTPVGNDTNKYTFGYITLLFFCTMILFFSDEKEKKALLFFPHMASLTVLIFWAQNKGFTLHALPIYPFLFSSALLTIKTFIAKPNQNKQSTILIMIIGMLIISNSLGLSREKPLTHTEFSNTKLANLLKEKANGKSFVFESLTTNIFYTLTLYTGNAFGSRFCSLWLVNYVPRPTKDNMPEATNYVYTMIAQDLNRFKPSIIGIENRTPPEKTLDKYFMFHNELAKEWANYKPNGTITLTRDEYKDPLKIGTSEVTYDLFIRQ